MNAWFGLEALRDWLPEMKSGLRIVAILAAAWIAQIVLRRLLRRARELLTRRAGDREAAKRIETVVRVIRYGATVVILLLAGLLVLNELGISIAPILGAAGVVGLAVGFGAQSLIKDYFNGFFLLVEDQIRVGDVVEIAGVGGLVEEITLRRVKLRDYDGAVHFVANGQITKVTNRASGFAYAVMDIAVAYKESIDAAIAVLRDVARGLRGDPDHAARILEDIEIAGVENLTDSAVVLRCRLKVVPLEQWNVKREFLKRTKSALEAAGIEIPFPQRTVWVRSEAPAGASALR